MKKILPLVCFLFVFTTQGANVPVNNYQSVFNQAYDQNPTIPRGVLEAISYTQTRFENIQPQEYGSCISLPQAFGVMGLVEDGKGYFHNNLKTVADISGYSIEQIKTDAVISILAYAKAYSVLQLQLAADNRPESQTAVIIALSELPNDNDVVRNYAVNAHLYQIYWFLNQHVFQEAYGFPVYDIDLEEIFGKENLKILSAPSVQMYHDKVIINNDETFKINSLNTVFSADYSAALWNPAATCNYSSRNGTAISAITIHDVEGTYAGCISWFQNCNASVSAHYVMRSSDGQCTQMVLEADKAWHVGSENNYTIGIEHEGYYTSPSWYTDNMYASSADLCRDICNSGYGINPLRCYNGPSCNGLCTLGSCVKIKGHQHYPNQTHNDPGQYWDWYKFYNLINNAPTVINLTAASGTFYDSGGPSGSYANDERRVVLIQPAGAASITLNFTQFDLETNWDYLYIYDGNTTSAPLIGRYTGATSPGVITSSGGSLLLDFRSDCATIATGWTANYTSTTGSTSSGDIIAPTTQVFTNGSWQTHSFTSAVVDADNSGGSGVQKGYYQVIDYNGTEWRANDQNGFFADNFDVAIHPDWTTVSGTWNINGQALEQSDESSGNTNIYAKLKQNLSNRYLYHFYAKTDGSGTNRRAGFHFACTQPDSLNRGDGYFVWFRTDDTLLQIYKVVNNSFGSPVASYPMHADAGQWYDYKVIYDRISGKIWLYQDNALIGTYTDSSPYANGTYISFRSGNSNFAINELKVYRSRAASVNVSVGSASTNDIRYQNPDPSTPAAKIKSICQDSADNLSSIYSQNLNIDWTKPMSIDSVRDGYNSDIDITDSTDRLTANWDNSFDTSSAIVSYWYAIGTAPGDSDIVGWTSNMVATSKTATGLSLQQGQMYYYSVKAQNGAGLFSDVYISDGQMLDTTSSVGLVNLLSQNESVVFPNPFSNELDIVLPADMTNKKINLSLTNMLGQEVFNKEHYCNSRQIRILSNDLTELSKGAYNLIIRCDDRSISHLLIKN